MANGSEKRQHKRLDAKVRVVFRSFEDLIQEYTQNISGGGIFIKTDKLLDPNAEIELKMTFPGDLGEYSVRGKVARLMSLSHPDGPEKQLYGIGVRFIDPDPEMIRLIEEALDQA